MGLAEMIEVREGKIEEFVEKYNIAVSYTHLIYERSRCLP